MESEKVEVKGDCYQLYDLRHHNQVSKVYERKTEKQSLLSHYQNKIMQVGWLLEASEVHDTQ